MIVSVAVLLLPLVRVSEVGRIVQVMPVAAVQVRLTAPLKPFTDETLTVFVALPLTLIGTIVFAGVSVKSESGLEMLI